ncbi:hypothetical protein HQ587_11155 [bacterium]|nr:hypothetical protein [bacterium]
MEITSEIKERLAILRKQIKEEPRLFAHLADCYLLNGETKQAAKTLIKGLEKYPNSTSGWLVKGNLHLKLKEPKLAYNAFKQALRTNRDVAYAHDKCAELAESESDHERSIQHLRELKQLDPLDDIVQTRLDTALMRRAAVEKGLYRREYVDQIMPKELRKNLLEREELPSEMMRTASDRVLPEISIPVIESTDKGISAGGEQMQTAQSPTDTQPITHREDTAGTPLFTPIEIDRHEPETEQISAMETAGEQEEDLETNPWVDELSDEDEVTHGDDSQPTD